LSQARHPHSEASLTGGHGLQRGSSFSHWPLGLLNAPGRGVTISAIAGMTVLQSNRSPRQYEPVSSRRYATRRGKGILRLETAGGCDRHRPKISVSLGLILRSECASAGYVGDIQRDWKSCNIKYLHGGAEGIRTDGHRGFPAANRGISPVNLKGDERQTRLGKATQP
jgi:hypothetical protein